MNMLTEITAEKIVQAYKKNNLRPRVHHIVPTGAFPNRCCAMGAYLAENHPDVFNSYNGDSCDAFVRERFGSAEVGAFYSGFDSAEDCYSEEAKKRNYYGCHLLGIEVRKAVNEAFPQLG